MKTAVIRAPLLSRSGYGEHSRQVFKYLLNQPGLNLMTQIVPWGITPWSVDSGAFNGLAGEATRLSTTTPDQKFDLSFQVQLPNEWDPSLASFNVGITAAVETDKCNPVWSAVHCNKMDLVIVPSAHIKRTLENSGRCTTRIAIVPESYFQELENDAEPLEVDLSSSFNFLTIGVLTGGTPPTDRKNLFYLIKWFVEEFRGEDDVGLIVKTNKGRETAIDQRLTESLLKQVLREVGHEGLPHVYLLHGNMTREEMTSLYRHPNVKALLSTTRGEGFGLPLLEASVAELPVVATDWSAHTEFLNLGKWIKLEYDLNEIHESRRDNNIFVRGARWAEVREKSFKKAIRKFINSNTVPKGWAIELSKALQRTHSEGAIFSKYDEVLKEVLS